jgi:hypothetical protein
LIIFKNNPVVKKTKKLLALKETKQDPRYANREGPMSKLLKHPGIIKFHDIFFKMKG